MTSDDRQPYEQAARDYDDILLALTLWREARGEGIEGMRAVAHVIANRVAAGWGDRHAIITALNQFTSMTGIGDSQTILWPTSTDPSFIAALSVVAALDSGTDTDPTNGALYYARLSQVTSTWFKTHIINGMDRCAVIGHHTFFKPKASEG